MLGLTSLGLVAACFASAHAADNPWEEVTPDAGDARELEPVPPPVRKVTPALQLSSGDSLMLVYSSAYGAYAGGVSGYLVGEAIEVSERDHTTEGVAPGVLIGAAAGTATGVLLVATQDYSTEEAWVLSSGTMVGGLLGGQLGRTFITGDATTERQVAAGLAGSMAGTGIGFLVAPSRPSVGSTLHFDLATGVGMLAANGISDMARLEAEDRRTQGGLSLAGGLAFGGLAVLANRSGLETPTATTVTLALGHGAWVGGMSPFLFSDAPDAQQVWGGAQVGAALGYASGLAMVALGQPSPKSAALQGLGITAGNAIGAGVPLALGGDGHPRAVVGPALAGGLLGQVGGALVAPNYTLSRDDVFLVSALGTWTGLQTAGWGVFASQISDTPSQPLGFALTAGGAGTLMTMGLAPVVDLPAASSMQLLASGGWGSWMGGWSGELLDLDDDEQWLAALGGGNGALLGTAVAEGLGWRPSWGQVGTINGLGLLGAAAGGLTGVVFLYDTDDWDPLVASTLVGSGVGLAGGAVLASLKPGGSGAAPQARLPGAGEATATMAARPWMDDEGNPGGWLEVRVDGW